MNSLMPVVAKLSYDEARSLIQDGDLLSFVPHSNNLLHRITQWVTKSSYYHSGVAVWMESTGHIRRLFVCEAHRSGRRLIPLSMYKGTKFDVTCCPIDWEFIEEGLLDNVGKIKYGFMDFVFVGVRDLFGITLRDTDGEICSEMVQDAYNKAGLRMPDYVLSPGELYEYLKASGIEDRVQVIA